MKILIILFFLIFFSIQENILTAEQARELTKKALEYENNQECKKIVETKIFPMIREMTERGLGICVYKVEFGDVYAISYILKKYGYKTYIKKSNKERSYLNNKLFEQNIIKIQWHNVFSTIYQ